MRESKYPYEPKVNKERVKELDTQVKALKKQIEPLQRN